MADNWDIAKIETHISSQIEESLVLEYKEARALAQTEPAKREISKDVSAMANSEGGVVIYGIAEFSDKTKEHLPEKIIPIKRAEFSKEWLESVILNIRPKIQGLVITPISLSEGSNEVVYVVEIPRSNTAHQALDFKYYKRRNFSAEPMFDNEIRDIMNRQQHPILKIVMNWNLYPYGLEGNLNFQIHNESNILARDYAAIIHAPMVWRKQVVVFDDEKLYETEDGDAWNLYFSNAVKAPLFPWIMVQKNFKFTFGGLNKLPEKRITNVRYKVFADSMPFLSGKVEVEEILNDQSKRA